MTLNILLVFLSEVACPTWLSANYCS